MGPKRGGKNLRSGRHEPRRDRGKTWDEEAENLEANVGRLKLENPKEEADAGSNDEEKRFVQFSVLVHFGEKISSIFRGEM